MEEIQRVGVVGCGVMGVGIVELCALRKLDVRVVVRSESAAQAGRAKLVRSLDNGVSKGRLTEPERDGALERASFSTDFAAMADREFVIESVKEDEGVKREIFRTLDEVLASPDAIIASNTSSIPIMKLGQVTARAEQVVGTHFFNPAPALPLVELVDTLVTDPEVSLRAEHFLADSLGKQVVRSSDRPGFLVNALLVPYLLSAIRMVDSGFASATDIDKAMVLGCAYPMGPLALVDLVGLDTMVDISNALHLEFKDAQFVVPPLLSRMVEAGMLGRKTGRGFHRYK